MKEIRLDTSRCPGIEVCGDQACIQYLGNDFYSSTLKAGGYGLVSETSAEANRDRITEAICRCPAGALSIQER